jgi:hypothetical protein
MSEILIKLQKGDGGGAGDRIDSLATNPAGCRDRRR